MRRIVFCAAILGCSAALPTIARCDNREIAQRIGSQLRESGRLANYNISVKYSGGTAWLSGRVASQEQLAAAIETSRDCPEVQNVVSQMQVEGGGESSAPPAPSRKSRGKRPMNQAIRRTSAMAPSGGFDPQYLEAAPPRALANQRMPTPRMPMKQVRQAGHFSQYPPMDMGSCGPDGTPYGGGPGGMSSYGGGGGMPGGMSGGNRPLPAYVQSAGGGTAPARFDQPSMPNYAWPSYAPYPNYAALSYPKQYSPTAWPYIGPFYPYPQVPLGWRKVTLEWDDGWWFLDFKDDPSSCWDCGN